jgi:hypothetical protein
MNHPGSRRRLGFTRREARHLVGFYGVIVALHGVIVALHVAGWGLFLYRAPVAGAPGTDARRAACS